MTAALAAALLAAWPGPVQAASQGTPAEPAVGQVSTPQGTKAPAPQGTKPTQGTKPAQPAKPPAPPPKPGSREPGRAGSFEVSAQALWLGAASLGARNATLTPNQSGSGGRYTLFNSSGELAASPGFAATVGYHLTRTLAVEGEFSYARPPVRVTVSGDVENAEGVSFDGENLAQYVVEGSFVAHIRRLSFSRGRGRTFVSAGVGYRREVHDGNLTIDTGQVYHAGGGLKYFFKPRARGFLRAFGIRAEARVLFGVGGFSFDGENTQTFSARGGAIVAF